MPLLPWNEFRMAQFALAFQPVEAFAQRGDKGRERARPAQDSRPLYQIVRLATTKAHPGTATVLVKLDGPDPAVARDSRSAQGQRRRLDVAKRSRTG